MANEQYFGGPWGQLKFVLSVFFQGRFLTRVPDYGNSSSVTESHTPRDPCGPKDEH
jgi:hypothetical protein